MNTWQAEYLAESEKKYEHVHHKAGAKMDSLDPGDYEGPETLDAAAGTETGQ